MVISIVLRNEKGNRLGMEARDWEYHGWRTTQPESS
jgi:hypothetical protein